MPKQIFTEIKAKSFSISCELELMQDPSLQSDMRLLVEKLRELEEDGRRVFDDVSNVVGQIDLNLHREVPLRIIRMWANRIEQMLQELRVGHPAV